MNYSFPHTKQRPGRPSLLPVFACVVLTGLGLYLLLLAGAPLGAIVLFGLALSCPLAVAVAWHSQPVIDVRRHTGGVDQEAGGH